MKNMHNELGLKQIINAAGKMTILGVSTISDEVAIAMQNGAQSFVDFYDLIDKSGQYIAKLLNAKGACVTASSSSSIALCIASLIAKNDLSVIRNYTRIEPIKNEVILFKGHNINYGIPIQLMIELAKGKVNEIGQSNRVDLIDLEGSINDKTLAIMYVQSHHAVQKNMLSLKQVIQVAKAHNIPVIVDAAAEIDFNSFIEQGADFVIYSGSKGLNGPSSSFVLTSNSAYAHHIALQYQGIGRAMKIGKENIFGLIQSIEQHLEGRNIENHLFNELENACLKLNEINGIEAHVTMDVQRPIKRIAVKVLDNYTLTANELVARMKQANPSVYTRDYLANQGIIEIDPRTLLSLDQLNTIIQYIKEGSKL